MDTGGAGAETAVIVTPDASVPLKWVLPGNDESDTAAALAVNRIPETSKSPARPTASVSLSSSSKCRKTALSADASRIRAVPRKVSVPCRVHLSPCSQE